jgi:hypothetical protein
MSGTDKSLEAVFDEAVAGVAGDRAAGWQARLAHREAAMERHEEEQPPKPPGPAKVRYTHDAMIDMVVANPWVSQDELARNFGYTSTWVSLIFSSDAFKERLEQRKQELVDPTIRATIEERLRSIVVRSLEVLGEKLAKPASQVPDNLVLRAVELGAKGLGIGGNAVPVVQLPPNHLEVLAQRLVQLQSRAVHGETYDGEAMRVVSG